VGVRGAQLLLVIRYLERRGLINRSCQWPVLFAEVGPAVYSLSLLTMLMLLHTCSLALMLWQLPHHNAARHSQRGFLLRTNLSARDQSRRSGQMAYASIQKQSNAEVLAEPLDVTDASAVHRFVETAVNRFGGVDICVTNAGGPPAKGFLAASLDDWRKAIELNFLSAVYFAREVIPLMQRKSWGRIITITSITTKQPVADLVLSNAVRAAVV